jgi:hypothetical protein
VVVGKPLLQHTYETEVLLVTDRTLFLYGLVDVVVPSAKHVASPKYLLAGPNDVWLLPYEVHPAFLRESEAPPHFPLQQYLYIQGVSQESFMCFTFSNVKYKKQAFFELS